MEKEERKKKRNKIRVYLGVILSLEAIRAHIIGHTRSTCHNQQGHSLQQLGVACWPNYNYPPYFSLLWEHLSQLFPGKKKMGDNLFPEKRPKIVFLLHFFICQTLARNLLPSFSLVLNIA